ncbi:MAG TPA: DNA polymerase III subunit alpha, partial [bacterium]|nr:DNA polymerase III subunit alpha [bacterium]
VRDIINYARANNIPVGPGRGSAAGSLISYLLGITSIDPMRYGLLFERFLNPDRVSPPDIDIDFSDDERGRIIEYIVQRFGRERTAQIITFQTLKPRQAIRDVGRVLDVPLFEVDRLAKMVPEGPNMNFENVMKNPEFVAYTNDDKTREEIVNYAIKIEGLLRQDSTHAAGIVIAPDDLTEYVPVAKPKDTDESRSDLNLMTQYPMESLDRAKLIKFDILGLRNLSVIKNALGMIKENTGKEVLLSNDDFSDAEVYAMLARGESSGVFQLESDGMRDVLMKMKPESFEDIIAIISLYRPGPMDMIDEYIKRRRGKKFEFDFPGLEPILKETYGIAVYQEQVMEIAVKIAGFSMARADILRRVMSKKKEKEMALLKVDFLKGAAERGAAKEAAEALFEKLEQFCQYGFNKSHAAAYAVVSYHTAYLKAHYPGEYMSAWLTSVMNKVEKVAQYVEECRRLNIKLMPPDVNKSGVSFTFQRGVIVYGLAAIKNVGVSAAEEIVRQRAEKGEYKSIYDFCEKVGMKAVNSKTIESLIKAGAFDFTLEKRSALFASVEAAMKLGEKRQKDILAGQGQLFGVEEKPSAVAVNSAEDWEESAILSFEKEVLGLYISNHPLAKFEKLLKSVAVPISEIKHGNVSAGDRVILGGVLDDLRKKLTPEREEKVSFRLEDLTDSITVYANEKVTEEKKTLFRNGVIFVIRGRVGFFDEKAVVFLDSIITIEEAYEKLGRYLHIKLREIGLEETALKEMHNILAMHRGGETEVILHMHAKDNSDVTMALDDNSRVKVNEELLTQLEAVVGEGNLHLSWQNKVQ